MSTGGRLERSRSRAGRRRPRSRNAAPSETSPGVTLTNAHDARTNVRTVRGGTGDSRAVPRRRTRGRAALSARSHRAVPARSTAARDDPLPTSLGAELRDGPYPSYDVRLRADARSPSVLRGGAAVAARPRSREAMAALSLLSLALLDSCSPRRRVLF